LVGYKPHSSLSSWSFNKKETTFFAGL
jgi:hypothetical protein